MKTNSIKTKVLLIIFISVVFSFAVLAVYSAQDEYKAEYSVIKNQELKLANENTKYINSFLASKIDIMNALSKELGKIDDIKNNKELLDKLFLSKEAGKFVDVYVGFEKDGSLILANGNTMNIEKDNYDARKRPWYQEAISNNKAGVSKPYLDITTKKMVVSVFTQLRKNGKVIGVVGSDIFIDTIVNTILHVKFKNTGYAYLLDNKGNILIHSNEKLVKKESSIFKQIKTDSNSGFGEAEVENEDFLASYDTILVNGWYFIVQLDKKEITDEIYSNIIKQIIIYVILLVIILTILYFAMSKLLAPINKVLEGLNFFFKYLKGEESVAKELNIKTNDEFGEMSRVIDEEIKQISKSLDEDKNLIEEVKSVVNHINDGKLDIQVKATTSNKALNDLKDILNEMIETINADVNSDINPILNVLEEYSQLNFVNMIDNPDGKVSVGLNNLCTIINEMLQENKENGIKLDESSKTLLYNVDTLNKSANETAVSLEETAAALEEITSTVVSNTNRIAEMSMHSDELSDSIKEGQELANSTVISMNQINEQTQAIAEAITVIDQIAFQTNILSLNAAVEAATAGEAGKGFAVVAQEVRNLAARSAEAAKEIKELVENATSKTDNGKQIADHMIDGYKKLNENIKKTTHAIGDISDASKEQKTSIEQINDVINRLDQQTQQNASVASQAHTIAQNTSELAEKILQAVHEKKFREN